MAITSVLSGLVAITGDCAFVPVWSAPIIGVLAATTVVAGTLLLERLGIDDPVWAFPVHGLNGVLGMLSIGLFAYHGGLLLGGGWHLVWVQGLGVGVVAAWGFGVTHLFLQGLNRVIRIRVPEATEANGLDIVVHGHTAYRHDLFIVGDEPFHVHARLPNDDEHIPKVY